MTVKYTVIQHDGGWAYKANGAISETFASHDEARSAAEAAAREQRAPGEATEIFYQGDDGRTRSEHSPSDDRPETIVVDSDGHARGSLSSANDK